VLDPISLGQICVMSSYQFVNSLASCYVGRGGSSGGDLTSAMSDYYATAMTNYQNCYNPAPAAQHYDFSGGGGSGGGSHPQSGGHPLNHSLPMSPMSSGGADFGLGQTLQHLQTPMQQQQQQQPQQQQQQPRQMQQTLQQQQQIRQTGQRLNSVASPVNLGDYFAQFQVT
jgi:hypothetical protein